MSIKTIFLIFILVLFIIILLIANSLEKKNKECLKKLKKIQSSIYKEMLKIEKIDQKLIKSTKKQTKLKENNQEIENLIKEKK